ncbi:hypothetical protein PoB_002211600 [Plakobranchus ocellatus]|uniref:DUF4371 domain-containing protein n=1 Tax=Plakobranchus ocellatus TaxID=259542 RepID=A0AAV3ZI76_9GAST|nr:hypothetical protein PoB_002211600 [Plakobranchus ocellatus]
MDDKPNQSSYRKRKWYNQSFKDEWLKDLDLKEWLVRDSVDKDSTFYKSCKTTIKNSNKSMLLRHKESSKHKESMRAATTSEAYPTSWSNLQQQKMNKLPKSELQIAAYFVEHNIHFLPVLKKICPDNKIAHKLSLKRTKLSHTIQDGIAFHEKMNITDICRNQKFSIIIDESTDISVTQVLAIVCRYFDMN